jgi:hypothetical protein
MMDGGTLKFLLEAGGNYFTDLKHQPVPDSQQYDLHATIVLPGPHDTFRRRIVIRNHAGTEPTGTDADYTAQSNETSMNELDAVALVRFLHGE